MRRTTLERLMIGYKKFHKKFYEKDEDCFETLAEGQHPKILVIGCCDSRVDPAIISSSSPGDLFVVRNIANLVPEFEKGGGRHGVSAAIEFAVINLEVEQIIILGHKQCGGIKALLFPQETMAGGFVQEWMKIAEPAKQKALEAVGDADKDLLCTQCEKDSISISLNNLRTFPFIKEAEDQGRLNLSGIYFDFIAGDLHLLNEDTALFEKI